MSQTPTDAPEVVVKNLIRDAWDPNRFEAGDEITPAVHHGWVDRENDTYEVTISNPQQFAIGGGETGYSGVSSDGEVRQDWTGQVTANCWAARPWTGVDGGTMNPRKATYLMAWQIKQIAKEHSNGTNAQGEQTDLETIAVTDARRISPSEDDTPIVWRYMVRVGFTYRD